MNLSKEKDAKSIKDFIPKYRDSALSLKVNKSWLLSKTYSSENFKYNFGTIAIPRIRVETTNGSIVSLKGFYVGSKIVDFKDDSYKEAEPIKYFKCNPCLKYMIKHLQKGLSLICKDAEDEDGIGFIYFGRK